MANEIAVTIDIPRIANSTFFDQETPAERGDGFGVDVAEVAGPAEGGELIELAAIV